MSAQLNTPSVVKELEDAVSELKYYIRNNPRIEVIPPDILLMHLKDARNILATKKGVTYLKHDAEEVLMKKYGITDKVYGASSHYFRKLIIKIASRLDAIAESTKKKKPTLLDALIEYTTYKK